MPFSVMGGDERYNDRPPCSARIAATGKRFSRHRLGGEF